MQLFLIVFAPGMLVCWLYVRKRMAWGHVGVGILLGAIASYGMVYFLGNYVQAGLIEEMRQNFGETYATAMTNSMYGGALKYSVGTIAVCAIAMKMRKDADVKST
jgi:hypothetical protein